ncbi:hypothetical protein K4H02_23270, partial [Mycobacterium tuberculosis]|nr:hypothetical protein [Mycobacterium tuberculosis]
CQSELLSLCAQEQAAALADVGLVTLRQAHDGFMQADKLGRFDCLGGIRAIESADYFLDRAAEQFDVLRQVSDMARTAAKTQR